MHHKKCEATKIAQDVLKPPCVSSITLSLYLISYDLWCYTCGAYMSICVACLLGRSQTFKYVGSNRSRALRASFGSEMCTSMCIDMSTDVCGPKLSNMSAIIGAELSWQHV